MMGFIHYHPMWAGAVGMFLFSNFVSTMPSPEPNTGMFYKWMFGFLHIVGAGLPRLIATIAPNSAMSKIMGVPPAQP